MPNAALETPRATPFREGQMHRITCPHCLIGWADILIEKVNGEVKVDLNQPRTCEKCGRYFRLKPRLQIVGVPLEEQG